MSVCCKQLEQDLINSPPKLHYWDGEKRVGGFGAAQFKLLSEAVSTLGNTDSLKAIETGAGLSTLWMLNNGIEVYSFVLSDYVVKKIEEYLNKLSFLKKTWNIFLGNSEEKLPQFSLNRDFADIDMAIIDGGHGIHTVFVDGVYINHCLKNGGFLLVDDMQMPSSRLLVSIMLESGIYKKVNSIDKSVLLVKLKSNKWLPDWGMQKKTFEKISSFI